MKPERTANTILSTVRARAKMHEFKVVQEDYNALPRDPAILFSLAVGLLGDVAASIGTSALPEAGYAAVDLLPKPQSWAADDLSAVEGLRFASIFFDAYLNSRLDETISEEFSLMCAAAYYLAGNVGSAAVIIRQMQQPGLEIAGELARLVYLILANDFRAIDGDHEYYRYTSGVLEALRTFFALEGGPAAITSACEDMKIMFYDSNAARGVFYSDLVSAICAHKVHNASRTILPVASNLEVDLWRTALSKPHFPIVLWPAQTRIAAEGLLNGRSAVIQMPTSAGKTRASEMIIRSAFLSERASLAVIVAPYRSLCHDIRGDLVVAFSGEPIRLDEVSDSFQLDLQLDLLLEQKCVLIVTPEKLLYMLRRVPELAERIGLVIYDEGHQFDGMTRGPTYELLLTSLKMALAPETQVVLISAVIGNAPDIAEWLLEDRSAVIDGIGLLPTAKSIAFASWEHARGQLQYVSPQDPDEREFFVPRIIEDVVLPRRARERTDKRFPEEDGGDVGLYLGLHIVENGSVAVFCGRKDSAIKICKRAVEIFDRGIAFNRPLEFSDADEVEKIRSLSEAHLGLKAIATQAAALGIFAHHADVPQGLRLAIEHAMKEGDAKFVVCTSTLAQGVNFPLKYLIVTSTRQGGEEILVRDFHNLMGRAGRAGMHTEGSVIFSTPAIYDQRNQFRHRWRWDAAKALLDPANAEPSRSGILSLFEDYEQRQAGAPPIVLEIRAEWLDLAFADHEKIDAVVREALAEQPNISANEFRKFIERRARTIQTVAAFLVAHMTFSDDETLERVDELAGNTLAYHLADDDTRARLFHVFRSVATSVIENTDDNQRVVIRRSPLPPSAVADLQRWFGENAETLVAAATESELIALVTPIILKHCSSATMRGWSRLDLLPVAFEMWVSGASFADIFATLDDMKLKIGRNKVTIEDVVALCENGFGFDAAMVAASLSDLAEGDDTLRGPLTLLQRRIKSGLSDRAALSFLEAGFADRYVAAYLGIVWPDATDRASVRAICRAQQDAILAVLTPIPSYFSGVARELAV